MRRRATTLLVVTLVSLALSTPATATTLLYDNGTLNGTLQALYFSSYSSSVSPHEVQVTDSFILTGSATLTQVQIGAWNFIGQATYSINWAIGTSPYGTSIGSGTALTTDTFVGTNDSNSPELYEDTFPLPLIGLGAGTYWLTLTDSVLAVGGVPITGFLTGWDVTDGPSAAYSSGIGSLAGYVTTNPNTGASETFTTGSESFEIYGSGPAVVPEPGTLLLLGPGLAGLWVWERKKFKHI
jgi:hypothetical protein